MKKRLLGIYGKLYKSFGPQHWWPADSALEVMVGAILTQNTSWKNVERAIKNLKRARVLSFGKLAVLSEKRLARMIRPAGYYNIKAKRLKNFFRFLEKVCGGDLKHMRRKDAGTLRQELLAVSGIGPETADSILLYALGKPVFVIDAYTKRIVLRHRLMKDVSDYQQVQRLFMDHLPRHRALFNEYHALLVRCAKEFCKKSRKKCRGCPIHEKN